jgi:hypothetical protein
MKRFFLLALPLCFAFAQVAPAQDGEDEAPPADDMPAAPVRGNRPAAQAPLRQPPVQANVPAMQQPQGLPGSANFRGGGGYNPNPNVQQPREPRIPNPQFGGGARQPRIFTPTNPAVTVPPTAEQPQPAVVQPGVVQPGTRTWTGRGGGDPGGDRRNWVTGRRGDWSTRGGIEGNQDWRNRRGHDDDSNIDEHANHHGRRGFRGRHRDWHRRHDGDPNFAQAHRRWHRQHQSRDWWRSRYSRFARFGGGYYYWNAGYWYPAYGYDPYFTTYTYNAPIYAYNNQDPGQIIASVQQELQRLGYYRGYLDGTYGPMTRRALLNYQRDNGLPVTGEIDADTLASLGFE